MSGRAPTRRFGFAPLPSTAAWQHIGLRAGFEVAFFEVTSSEIILSGASLAVEGTSTSVAYEAPQFDFAATLAYDGAGRVLDYPGLARRVM